MNDYTIIISETQRAALLDVLKQHPYVTRTDPDEGPLAFWLEMLEHLPADDAEMRKAYPDAQPPAHGFCY